MKKIFAAFLFIFSSTVACSQEAYICIPKSSTGFRYNKLTNNWEQTQFKVSEEKKIIRKTDRGWERRIFGEKSGDSCKGDFNEYGFLFCYWFGGQTKFNRKHLRYLETYEIGYIDGKDVDGNTPYIEIGTCSPL